MLIIRDYISGTNLSAFFDFLFLGSPYASCRKVRPRVYWVLFAALLSGKYRVRFSTLGYDAERSKLAYGKTISTLGPPFRVFPSLNIKLGFLSVRF